MALRNIVSIIFQGKDEVSKTTEKVDKDLGKLGGVVDELKAQLIGPAGLVAALGATAAGVIALATSAANRADQIGKFADRIGVTTEFLSEMETVADRAGVPVNQLQTGLQRLSRRAAEFATTGGGEAADTFKRLGIEVRNADGTIRNAESLIPELADKFANLEDEAEATALAFKLFDTEGVSFLQFLKQGGDALEATREEARLFGRTVTDKSAQAAAEFNDQVGRLKDGLTGLGETLADVVIPTLGDMAGAIADIAKELNSLPTGSLPLQLLTDEDVRRARDIESAFGVVLLGRDKPAEPDAVADDVINALDQLDRSLPLDLFSDSSLKALDSLDALGKSRLFSELDSSAPPPNSLSDMETINPPEWTPGRDFVYEFPGGNPFENLQEDAMGVSSAVYEMEEAFDETGDAVVKFALRTDGLANSLGRMTGEMVRGRDAGEALLDVLSQIVSVALSTAGPGGQFVSGFFGSIRGPSFRTSGGGSQRRQAYSDQQQADLYARVYGGVG